MQACRRFAAEYVAKHLHGLQIFSTLPVSITSHHNKDNNVESNDQHHDNSEYNKIIATHNGMFHCDEAMACGFLRHTNEFAHANVIRTRNMELINQANIVVDVGAEYDASRHRYDHHQPEFHDTMQTSIHTYQTRLSSAGLVYRHFGKEVIMRYISACLSSSHAQRHVILELTGWPDDKTQLSDSELEVVYDYMYKNFVEAIDGVDNGVNTYALADKQVGKLVSNYIEHTSLTNRVGDLQSWWNEPKEVNKDEPHKENNNNNNNKVNASFVEAVELTCHEFFCKLSYCAFSWLPARNVVAEAFQERMSIHPSGAVIAFKGRFCPFKEHLFQIEEEEKLCGSILYVIFTDGNVWRVQAVPKELGGFDLRKPLPYRGLRDAELSEASGIEGGIFVHASGFIGGMTTYDGALKLAIAGLEQKEE